MITWVRTVLRSLRPCLANEDLKDVEHGDEQMYERDLEGSIFKCHLGARIGSVVSFVRGLTARSKNVVSY
jgi:hypothetical protein